MGIRIVRFERRDGLVSWGRLEQGVIRAIPGPADSLSTFLREKAWKQASVREEFQVEDARFLSPVTAPCQVVCQGKNYLDHLLETGLQARDHGPNILFTKADSCLAPAEGKIRRPPGVRLLDYELELGLVIGSDCSGPKAVTEANLHEFVAGLVMANDVSARDVQVPQRQWFKGKSFRGFCPVGPVLYLMEPHDFSRLLNLELHLTVNGESRQKANTKQLMHRPAETLAEISRTFDLRVGDLLLTGTPGGVAMRVKPKSWLAELRDSFRGDRERFSRFVEEQASSPRYLKDGDRIESTIRSADGVIDLGRQRLVVTG